MTTPHINFGEEEGFAEICIEADHENQRTFVVTLSTNDSSALGKSAASQSKGYVHHGGKVPECFMQLPQLQCAQN